jgi:hypothetical protein
MPLKLPLGFAPPPGLPHPSGLSHPLIDVNAEFCQAMSDRSTTDASDSPATLSDDAAQLNDVGYIPGHALRSAIAGPTATRHPSNVSELPSATADQPEACGLPGCPSVGSMHHHLGLCVPCDFIHRNDACRMGAACKFCHLCGPGANRQKKKQRARAAKFCKKWQEAMAEHMRAV